MLKKTICCLMAAMLLLTSAACGSKAPAAPTLKEGVTLQSIVDTLAEKYGFTMPAELDDSILKDFLGIDPEDVEEYTGYITMVNISTDNLIAIKAKEGKVEMVQKKLEERQDAQAKEFEQYLQDQYQKVTAGKVIVIGDYVFLATLCRMDEDPATEAADIETFIRGSFTE